MHIINLLKTIMFVNLLNKPSPLFALWNVTFKCNLHCAYCGVHTACGKELDTASGIQLLDHLWKHGVRWLTFGGGEPLVRSDIVDLCKHAYSSGFTCYISTNGWLLYDQVEILKYIYNVNLSLDGNREIHDQIRGPGAFDKVLNAARLCTQHNKRCTFICVLSKLNIDRVFDVLEIAKEFNSLITFQPATTHLNTSSDADPLVPSVDRYRQTIEQLIQAKRMGAPIRNSIAGLKHLAKWPNSTPIPCSAGRAAVVVEPNGQILGCHHLELAKYLQHKDRLYQYRERPHNSSVNCSCSCCWCANLVELNLITALKIEPIINSIRNGV